MERKVYGQIPGLPAFAVGIRYDCGVARFGVWGTGDDNRYDTAGNGYSTFNGNHTRTYSTLHFHLSFGLGLVWWTRSNCGPAGISRMWEVSWVYQPWNGNGSYTHSCTGGHSRRTEGRVMGSRRPGAAGT